MKKNLTEIVFILDRSGSMSGLERDTIGGYNSMLEKQRKEEGEACVSTVLFDNYAEVIHDRVPIDKIKDITDKEYYVRGCTALLDAVGGAIHHIAHIHKYAREEDILEKTIFIITTDGFLFSNIKMDTNKIKASTTFEVCKNLRMSFLLGGKGDYNLTKSDFDRPPPPSLDFFAKLKGWTHYYNLKLDRNKAETDVAFWIAIKIRNVFFY